jgi:hypothetical protein
MMPPDQRRLKKLLAFTALARQSDVPAVFHVKKKSTVCIEVAENRDSLCVSHSMLSRRCGKVVERSVENLTDARGDKKAEENARTSSKQ